MANTISTSNVVPVVYAQGVLALRQNAITPRLVNRNYDRMAALLHDAINVPIPSALTATNVTPSSTASTNVDSAPTRATVTLDNWKEVTFFLTDKEQVEAAGGIVAMQTSEAAKALVNAIDATILANHVKFFSTAGSAGTVPFSTNLFVAGSARTLLNKQLAPMGDRFGLLDPTAEGGFLTVPNIIQADQRGDQGGIIPGSIGTKLGFVWHMNQNITTFTPGSAWVTGYTVATGGVAAGATTLSLQDKTGGLAGATSSAIKVGDIFTLAGEQYRVTAAVATITVSSSAAFTVSIYPAARAAALSGVAATVIATTYTANIAAHRDSMAFVSRPLGSDGLGNLIMSDVDPISGIAMRLEVSRQNRQTTWGFDSLWGTNVLRPELGTKILG